MFLQREVCHHLAQESWVCIILINIGLLGLPFTMQELPSTLQGMSPSNETVVGTVFILKWGCSKGNQLPNRNIIYIYPLAPHTLMYAVKLLEGLTPDCTKLVGKKKIIHSISHSFLWSHFCKHWAHQPACQRDLLPLELEKTSPGEPCSFLLRSIMGQIYMWICLCCYLSANQEWHTQNKVTAEHTLQTRKASGFQLCFCCSFKSFLSPTLFLS